MRIRTLDLFAGCGGSSAGASKAGAQIVAAIDAWKLATSAFRDNFPRARIITNRVERVAARSLEAEIGPINLLLASPECTNHTCAKGSAQRSEESRKTALQVLRFARAFEPRWIVIENVIQMKAWRRYRGFIQSLKSLGYNIVQQVLEAKDFGVAQSRRRLFIVCDRERMPPKIRPTPGRRTKAAREVIKMNGEWKSTPLFTDNRATNTVVRYLTGVSHLGENQPFLLVYYGTDGGGGWQRLDRPLRTVTTVDRFALVKQGRREPKMRMLQVPELQRAMGFDSGYKLNGGTRRDRIKLLGNAVCPPVMTAIVRSLVRHSKRRAKPLDRKLSKPRGEKSRSRKKMRSV
jgi:DNA (cytosine-5)-methyltransferase 1